MDLQTFKKLRQCLSLVLTQLRQHMNLNAVSQFGALGPLWRSLSNKKCLLSALWKAVRLAVHQKAQDFVKDTKYML